MVPTSTRIKRTELCLYTLKFQQDGLESITFQLCEVEVTPTKSTGAPDPIF